MHKPAFELSEIISTYQSQVIASNSFTPYHRWVLKNISECRTASFGGHIDRCNQCSHIRISYNSYRNRHCPKCQVTNRERWIEAGEQELLPVHYFHVVFTIPEELNTYCLHYPAACYKILFDASKETILTLGYDPKHLGAEMGMVSVLHTWGQRLSLHPHVDMIVPGGGVLPDSSWKHCKQKGKYLFPEAVMAKMFRGKFMEKLCGLLKAAGEEMKQPLRNILYSKNWIVYCKDPFLGPKQVIEYLGRYTHKIAITNHRIKSIDNDKIVFRYKDYRAKGKTKLMGLDVDEFLRRFCMHI